MVRERVQRLSSTLTAAVLSSLETDDDDLPSVSRNNLRIQARSRSRYLRNARTIALFQVPVFMLAFKFAIATARRGLRRRPVHRNPNFFKIGFLPPRTAYMTFNDHRLSFKISLTQASGCQRRVLRTACSYLALLLSGWPYLLRSIDRFMLTVMGAT